MIYYYQNPKTRDLIIFDSEKSEMMVLERIENIQISLGKNLPMREEESGNSESPVSKANQRKRRKWTDGDMDRLVEMRKEKKTGKEMAQEFGCSVAMIYKKLKEHQEGYKKL